MNSILNLFLSGTVVSLPSIVAALGILINNNRASARQKNDRKINKKIELIERIYSNFENISDSYILTMSSLEKHLYEIQEEILEKGTDNALQNYVLEMNELSKKAVFLAVHKRKILDIYRIKVDADELAKHILEVTKKIVIYADTIAFVTKLYVVKYYETTDKETATQAVIQELKNEVDRRALSDQYGDALDVYLQDMENPRKELVKDYNSALITFDDQEKRNISSRVSLVTRIYISELNKIGFEPLDKFEEQIVTAIKKLVK